MIDMGRGNVLGVRVSIVDYEMVVSEVVYAAGAKRPFSVTALAVHGVMTGVFDQQQRYRLNHLDMVVPDGQPVRWALNALRRQRLLADRVYGPTLMLRICTAAAEKGLPVFLYGSTPSVLAGLTRGLQAQCPGLIIAGTQASAFRQLTADQKQTMMADIRASGAAMVFVGLGCPRQETFAYECRDGHSMPVIAVGAAFDFHAGSLPQAPALLQRVGLEWAFRLVHEPRRLWRRYLFLNPAFVGLFILQAIGVWDFDPLDTVRPLEELRYG